ncbi:serine hydrolase [Xanthocytophaga agilis]|uniref:beta-lactamase n=1 Tax=Xanthocytophaga agilis TaxID=3048010 RepID=A0AAE3RDV0_9BACT|nr:serine hydrolase [Xanthocytophaga agilis]MDJ1506937.1 serine hydrolase [Xanthocytophaga agilis]
MAKYLLLLMVIFPLTLKAQMNSLSAKDLKAAIESKLVAVKGQFAVAFKSLDSPKLEVYIHEKDVFHAASTMKTPVMIEVFDQVKVGKFKLSDSILVKNEFKSIVDGSPYKMDISDDSAEEMYKKIGQWMTIRQLVYEMITVSSNMATNLLIDKVGASNVMNTMQEIGAKDMRILRGVEDQKAFDKGWNNTVTAYDLAIIFEKIARGQVVDRKSSEEMVQILKEQKFNDIIPLYLPKEVKIAHKTGFITSVRHDSAIIYLPDGRRYVLILLSKGLENPEAGVEALARVSEIIYEFMMDQLK